MEKYITNKFIKQINIPSTPNYDFVDNDNPDIVIRFKTVGDYPWKYVDSGLVKIDVMVQELLKLVSEGSNYVGCEWHADHGEMELYGFKVNESTPDEIDEYLEKIKLKEVKSKKEEIRLLESKLSKLKQSLEEEKNDNK